MSSTSTVPQPDAYSMSNAELLAAYFNARPGRWIGALELARVGGLLSFRTRLSELRRPPFNMAIRNRVRHIKSATGRAVVTSEYRLERSETSR